MPNQPEQNEEVNAVNSAPKQRKVIGKPFVKGQSGNPKGRPKGISIKDRVRQWLETHPKDMEGFVMHFVKENRDLAWQMLEGRPSNAIDITTGGKPFVDDETKQISKKALDEYLGIKNETTGNIGQG